MAKRLNKWKFFIVQSIAIGLEVQCVNGVICCQLVAFNLINSNIRTIIGVFIC